MFFAPPCFASLSVTNGVVTPGTRAEGIVVVHAPQAIPNAHCVKVVFRSTVTSVSHTALGAPVKQDLFVDVMSLQLPAGEGLVSGRHRLAFSFDVPPWLPPRSGGPGWSVDHAFETRVEVDWAQDPVDAFPAKIAHAPVKEPAVPAAFRSPETFHERALAEVVLDAVAVSNRSPLFGRVSIRSGADARFDALTLTLESAAKVHFLGGQVRTITLESQRISAEKLRDGVGVPFQFSLGADVPPTFKTGVIDHHLRLWVGLESAARSAPFSIGLRMLPLGSTVEHVGRAPEVATGSVLAAEADAMARATGLRRGELPVLVEGSVGPVDIRISDEPRAGNLGARVELAFPELELGVALDSLRPLRLRTTQLHPELDKAARRAVIEALTRGLDLADDLALSDTRLDLHVPVTESMVAIATDAKTRAETLTAALRALPFGGAAASHAAWQATANEQEGFLVPHVPALHRLAFRSPTLSGETRTLLCTLRTNTRDDAGRTIVAELDLRGAPLPPSARAALENTSGSLDVLRSIRTTFDSITVESATAVTLSHPTWTPDPRVLFPALQLFFDWVLDARGERRVASPYR